MRLVTAAAFAYTAKLPMYVFHSEAGVFGKSRFEDTTGISSFQHLLRILPPDLPNWRRNDGLDKAAPFTAYAGGQANRYWSDDKPGEDGCVRNIGGRKGSRFVCVPIGIRPGGLQLEARENVRFRVHHPATGEVVQSVSRKAGERLTLPRGPGAYLLIGEARQE